LHNTAHVDNELRRGLGTALMLLMLLRKPLKLHQDLHLLMEVAW